MRSTLQIMVAVAEDTPATEQELRYALHAAAQQNRLVEHALHDLAEAVRDRRSETVQQFLALSALKLLDTMFQARKTPVDTWLGASNIPGSPEQQERLRVGKVVFKKATGIDLDAP